MRRNVDSETPKIIASIAAKSSDWLPNAEDLLYRAERAVETSKYLVRLVAESGMNKRPDLLEERYNFDRWWSLHDYSAGDEQISSCDVTLGVSPRVRIPKREHLSYSISNLIGLSDHRVTMVYSEASGAGRPPLEREVSAADRISLRGSIGRLLGKRAIKHSLGIAFDIARTQQEHLTSLSTAVQPLVPWDREQSLQDYYKEVSKMFDESLPSSEDFDLMYTTIIPRVQDILASNGLRVRTS